MRILTFYLLATVALATKVQPQEQRKTKRGVLGSEGLTAPFVGLDLGNSLESAGISGGYTSGLSIGTHGGLSNGISGLNRGYGSHIGTGMNGGLSTSLTGGISGELSGGNVQTIGQQVPVVVPQQYPVSRPVSAPYFVHQTLPLVKESPPRVSQLVSATSSQSSRVPVPIPQSMSIQQTAPQSMLLSGGPSLGSNLAYAGHGSGIPSGRLNTGLGYGHMAEIGVGLTSGAGPVYSPGLTSIGSSLGHSSLSNYGSGVGLNYGYGSGLNYGFGSIGIPSGGVLGSGYGSGLGFTLGSGTGPYGLSANLGSGYGAGYGYSTHGALDHNGRMY